MMSASLARADSWVAQNFSLEETDSVSVQITDGSTPYCQKNNGQTKRFAQDDLLRQGAVVTEEPSQGPKDYEFHIHPVIFKHANDCVGVVTLSLRKWTPYSMIEGKMFLHQSYAARYILYFKDFANSEPFSRIEIKGFIADRNCLIIV